MKNIGVVYGKEKSSSLSGEDLFGPLFLSFSLFSSISLFALDNSVSSSKLPSIVVILLVRGLIESSQGSFATAPDPIVHSIIGAGNETQDYMLRSFRQIFAVKKKIIKGMARRFSQKE